MHRDGSPSELDDAREDAEDRQQLFVQQVAETLAAAMAKHAAAFYAIGGEVTPSERYVAEKLAPRVAAAISAAHRAWRSPVPGDRERHAEAAALSALRGETP